MYTMSQEYYLKYLKYKSKYTNLKKMIGGADEKFGFDEDDEIINKNIDVTYADKKISMIPNKLYHIWFKIWPDQGVPPITAFYNLIKFVYDDIKMRKGTTVVHCAGGIGRTGTVCMTLKLLSDVDNKIVTKENLMQKMKTLLLITRQHRPQAVEQVLQFDYIYKVVSAYLANDKLIDLPKLEPNSQLRDVYCKLAEGYFEQEEKSKSFCETDTQKNKIALPIEEINYSCGYDEVPQDGHINKLLKSEAFCLDKENEIKKNRFNTNPASKDYRISLCDKNNKSTRRECYINADQMPSLIINGDELNIIATQAHIQSSINDFKQMVRNYDVKRIVMLTGLYQIDTSGKSKIKINNIDTQIKEKADDYINLNAKVGNNYQGTYFVEKDTTVGNTDMIDVVYNDNIIKIGQIHKSKWYNSYI